MWESGFGKAGSITPGKKMTDGSVCHFARISFFTIYSSSDKYIINIYKQFKKKERREPVVYGKVIQCTETFENLC